MDYQAKALIIKTNRLNDADKIIHLWALGFGKIEAVAKSAYKLNSSLGAKTNVLNLVEGSFAKGKNLDIIKELKLVSSFPKLRSDLDTFTWLYFLLELAGLGIYSDNPDEVLEYLLLTLDELENLVPMERTQLLKRVLIFMSKIIELLGYKPELNICGISGKQRSSEQIPKYFDFANGYILSASIADEIVYIDSSIKSVPSYIFKILQAFDLDQSLELSPLKLNLDEGQALLDTIDFLRRHLEYRVHREFKSWNFVL